MNIQEKHNTPRILVNYGNGCEVLDFFAQTQWSSSPAQFVWWSKSPQALRHINERLPEAQLIQSQTRHLAGMIPPYPLQNVFPQLCNDEKIEAAARTFPPEWIEYVLRWDKARAAQLGQELDKTYSLLAALHLAEAVRMVATIQPDLLLLRGGTVLQDAALGMVARTYDVPILYTERGAFPDSLFLAPAVIGPEMTAHPSFTETANDESQIYSDAFIMRYMNHDRSAWMQPGRASEAELRQRWNIPEDYRIVFYAAQRPADANMLLNSPHFSSNGEFIAYVVKALQGVEKTALVIKPHPKELPEFDAEIHQAVQTANQNGVMALCDREVNIKDAIGLSSVVVSINSTTGLEALLYGVPVVAGGEAYYTHHGYTFDVKSATDARELERLRSFLKQPDYSSARQADFRNFICRLNTHHQFFKESAEGQNTPAEYLQTIVDTASRELHKTEGRRTRIPSEILCGADALLQQYSLLGSMSVPAPFELLKSHLRHKWAKRRG
jgi:uncharacterized protein YdhG (YjbR/CyaY superfamily)